MNKPKALKKGDRVAVIAPSSPISEGNRHKIKEAEEGIRNMGFEPVMYPSCNEVHGYLSGTDEIRAKDINDAFEDKNIDGIICMRGGYGTPRLLKMLNYEMIKANPKVFIGYSDITALHVVFNKICNMVTFHGPMASSDCFISDKTDYYTLESFEKNICNTKPLGIVNNPEGEDIITINGGKSEGEIVGGNLSLLAATLGSKYDLDTKGKILFIEEVGEHNYCVDRMLSSLALAGKFEDCAGVILGTWNKCERENNRKHSLDLEEIFDEIIKPFGKPIINNFRVGHVYPQATIPFGTRVRLDADKKEIEFLESACI